MPRRVNLGIGVIVVGAILIGATLAHGQTSSKNVTQKTGEAADAITKYTVEKKKEAVAYGKKLMNDLDAKIKEMEAQLSRDTSAVKADAKRQLNELKAARAKASKKLDELGRASAESWDSVKQAFVDAYKDLQRSFDKAAASLRS